MDEQGWQGKVGGIIGVASLSNQSSSPETAGLGCRSIALIGTSELSSMLLTGFSCCRVVGAMLLGAPDWLGEQVAGDAEGGVSGTASLSSQSSIPEKAGLGCRSIVLIGKSEEPAAARLDR